MSLRLEHNYPSKWDRFNISLTKAKYIEKKHAFLEIKSQLHVLLYANVSVQVTIRRYDMWQYVSTKRLIAQNYILDDKAGVSPVVSHVEHLTASENVTGLLHSVNKCICNSHLLR